MMRSLTIILISIVLISGATLFSYANDENLNSPNVAEKKSLNWWEKRHKRADIYFPHNAHMSVMKQRGDLCMACHPFTATPKTTIKQQQQLTALANEPLEAICHECHMVERSAPLDCKICHTDIDKVRPKDHGLNYNNFHSAAARQSETECRSCHIEMSFCTDCHFRHNNSKTINHPLGYRDRHGLDARLDTYSCGRCHNASYCRDCHRGKGK